MIGNDFTESTFRYANKRIFRLPIPAACTFPWPDGKNWERARQRFLFFSSGGMIRKGLDLVLEAFARMPEYTPHGLRLGASRTVHGTSTRSPAPRT